MKAIGQKMSDNPLKILITAGGTREYIDDVRVITNVSSGKLGAMLYTEAWMRQHDVTLLTTKGSILPTLSGKELVHTINPNVIQISTAQEAFNKMKELVPQMDVVIHAMAVSDFGFDLKEATKLSSGDPEAFIEHLRKTIKINPKILSHIKDWNPQVRLISFKFTVGSKDKLKIANKQMGKSKSDFVFVNDKEEMRKASNHVGTLIRPVSGTEYQVYKECKNKEEIVEALLSVAKMPRRWSKS